MEGLRQRPHDAVRRQRPRHPRLRHDRRRRRRARRPPLPRRRAGGRPHRAQGAELRGQRLLLQRDRRARLDRRQQGDLRHRGREPLARRRRLQQRHRPTSQAIQRAVNAGIVVAVAAGNAGPGTCTVGTPGAAPAALTVGAMTDLGPGGFYLASFSSRGPTADGRIKPDVVAPGVSVTSAAANTTSGYSIYSGTSMATPFVAGVVAADARREPVADAAADQGRHDLHRGGLGPAGRRRRLRRGPARRLRGAARGRRAARHDRRRRCRRTPSAAAASRARARAPTSRSTSPTRSTRSRRR